MRLTSPDSKKYAVRALADACVDQILSSKRKDKRVRTPSLDHEGVLHFLISDVHRKLCESSNPLCCGLAFLPKFLEGCFF
mmetsp:Transcript_80132/g.194302  ORF Transcript_80132/g.194302 Transcript_80132/m.194302 type:complete len:80 (+) Transcript_80132:1243-1482(+)